MSQAPAAKPPAPRRLTDKPTDESLKETFESVIIAFILAFVFRAYVVEAFVIPTGSMGPTLLGEHMQTVCGQCGYRFDADARNRPRNTRGEALNTYIICPMCNFPNNMPAQSRTSSGDRILVHKYVYSIVEPSRWDVVVFKDPSNPSENFIKRLVGLPNEKIWIVEGNVYVQPADESSDWQIARKTQARHGYRTQRDLWRPIYHSQYIPLDKGQPSIARQVNNPEKIGQTLDLTWTSPWVASKDAENWQIEHRRSYVHTQAGQGRIEFDIPTAIDPLKATWYPYNQLYQGRQARDYEPELMPEDLRIGATFEPQSKGLSVTLSTQARINLAMPDAPPSTLSAHITSEGQAWLEETTHEGVVNALTSRVNVSTFTPGRGKRVELWYVDQEASLWVDGKLVALKRFELPMESIVRRLPLSQPPRPAIEVNGPAVTLHEVNVDRDIHYTMHLAGSTLYGLGTLQKSANGQIYGRPATLSDDQFYCLGDNGPMSSDSRFWSSVNPWIKERMIEPGTQVNGIVPRKLMLGRAFFVYFPAMYPLKPEAASLVPNFADLRFIH